MKRNLAGEDSFGCYNQLDRTDPLHGVVLVVGILLGLEVDTRGLEIR